MIERKSPPYEQILLKIKSNDSFVFKFFLLFFIKEGFGKMINLIFFKVYFCCIFVRVHFRRKTIKMALY